VPEGRVLLAAAPHLLHKPQRFCGAAGFAVLLKQTALTEAKRRPFLDPETTCLLTPLPRKDKLARDSFMRAGRLARLPLSHFSVAAGSTGECRARPP
jgi:hypothetical protein